MKKILITGCSGSLGSRISTFFLKKNFKIIGVDLVQPNNIKPKKINFYKCNLQSEQNIKKISNKIKKKYKNIDILINAAGYIHNELFVNYKNEFKYHKSTTWKKTINSNLNSVFFSTKNFLPLLMESNNSDKLIINFSSVNSDGIVGQAAYSASKKAVEILTKVWAKEFAPFKIRVACISPGYINTESTLKNTKEKSRKKILEEIPSKRFGEINEILNSLNFILNNRYFNGKILKIDGGL